MSLKCADNPDRFPKRAGYCSARHAVAKATTNDADRLRKYLNRFGIEMGTDIVRSRFGAFTIAGGGRRA